MIDSYKSQTSFRDKLQEYKDIRDLNRAGSASPDKAKSTKSIPDDITEETGAEMTAL